jgi:ribA/ribD-fused uncharacterized protein
MKYWSGKFIESLGDNDVFVFGSNPEGRHGAGAAAAAVRMGAKFGDSTGFSPNKKTYAIITKNLKSNYTDKYGVTYPLAGERSISTEIIRDKINILYKTAIEYPEKSFLITYQYETYPNGAPKKSLNGYTSQEMLEMFVKDQNVPDNIVFHDSYKPHLEKLLAVDNKNSVSHTQSSVSGVKNQSVTDLANNLIVVSPRDKVPDGFTVINTTSHDKGNLGKQFSPFYLSNIPVYEGQLSKNLENAWQFSKVYSEYADISGNPTPEYFQWAKKGWNDSFAHRYANGKGNIPLYSYWKTLNTNNNTWEEHKWDYVTARKNIYFPLYAKAIAETSAFQELEQRVKQGEKIALWDFDGYDHASRNMSYEDVVNSPDYKCGHAFVLYGLLTGQLKLINDELIYDFKNEITMENNNINDNISNTKTEYTYFFHLTSPFSNFHPAKFEYKELKFISNEQFMMYSKAKTFKDEVTAKKILELNDTPLAKSFIEGTITREQIVNNKDLADQWNTLMKQAKNLGRGVSNFNEKVWDEKRTKVVLFGAREKFTQNEDLKQILMATGDTKMVEASKYDKIWGNGLSEYDSKNTPPEKWPGMNLLGLVLDYVKSEFKNNLNKKMKM